MEKSVMDAKRIAVNAGWLSKGGKMFCPAHHRQAADELDRRPSPKIDLLVALISQRPGLDARGLAEVMAGRRAVSPVRVNQVTSLCRAAMLRGSVVKKGRGWYPVERSQGAAVAAESSRVAVSQAARVAVSQAAPADPTGDAGEIATDADEIVADGEKEVSRG
jgi:hypothetical protein